MSISISKTFVMTLAAASLAVTAASADPKPKNTKRADNQTIANFYAGQTRIWKSCKGGIYFGAKFQAQAYCNKEGPGIGLGKWSVSKGSICSDLIWYWREGEKVVSKPGDSRGCIHHVVDSEGTIWRKWESDPEWWRLQDVKKDKNAVRGFKFKTRVNRLRRKLGV